jgi:hypothetical protein
VLGRLAHVEDLLHERAHKVLVGILVDGAAEPLGELVDAVEVAGGGVEGALGERGAEARAQVAEEELDVFGLVGGDGGPLLGGQAGARGVEEADEEQELDVGGVGGGRTWVVAIWKRKSITIENNCHHIECRMTMRTLYMFSTQQKNKTTLNINKKYIVGSLDFLIAFLGR